MPNELSLPTTGLDSREIARICGKRHDHVLRDIRAMLSALYPDGRGLPRFEETYVDEQLGNLLELMTGYTILPEHLRKYVKTSDKT